MKATEPKKVQREIKRTRRAYADAIFAENRPDAIIHNCQLPRIDYLFTAVNPPPLPSPCDWTAASSCSSSLVLPGAGLNGASKEAATTEDAAETALPPLFQEPPFPPMEPLSASVFRSLT